MALVDKSPQIDPSEHLKLIYRIIHQMGLRGDDAEETCQDINAEQYLNAFGQK